MLDAGKKAPLATLYNAEEKAVKLSDLTSAGPVLLAFFKVSCPICQLTFPFLERLATAPGLGGLRIFGVSQDPPRITGKFNERFGITLPMLYDLDERGYPVSNAFQITNVPSMFLIEPDGAISWASMGFAKRELESLASRVNTVLFRPDEPVPEWKAG